MRELLTDGLAYQPCSRDPLLSKEKIPELLKSYVLRALPGDYATTAALVSDRRIVT
jgi:hypothetical protein